MSSIALTVINRVTRNRCVNRNQSWNIGKAVIANPEECEIVASKVVLAQAIELVLLSLLWAFKKAVSKSKLTRNPCVGVRIARCPSGHEVGIAIVAGDLHEAVETRLRNIGCSHVD